jgi:hypothetical protein
MLNETQKNIIALLWHEYNDHETELDAQMISSI